MDTRKLEDLGHTVEVGLENGDDVQLHEIITKDDVGSADFNTLFYAFDKKDATELMRRWNAHNELAKWVRALVGRMRELDEHLSQTERTEVEMAEHTLIDDPNTADGPRPYTVVVAHENNGKSNGTYAVTANNADQAGAMAVDMHLKAEGEDVDALLLSADPNTLFRLDSMRSYQRCIAIYEGHHINLIH